MTRPSKIPLKLDGRRLMAIQRGGHFYPSTTLCSQCDYDTARKEAWDSLAKDVGGTGLGWRNVDPEDPAFECQVCGYPHPDTDYLDGFLATYSGNGRTVLDLDLDTWEGGHSPFIVVRSQGRVFVLNPILWEGDHVCIDAHAFVDGTSARTGVFGMDNGARVSFPSDKVHGTSHGWPATPLVALMLGKQKEV